MAERPEYDYHQISKLRGAGATWEAIGEQFERAPSTVRQWHKKMTDRRAGVDLLPDDDTSQTSLLTEDQIERITTLDDLINFFQVDTERWMVRDFRVNKWEQHSVQKGVTPLYQVRANLIRNIDREVEIAEQALRAVVADMQEHAPTYSPPEYPNLGMDDGVLYVLGLMDPHLGMLAWGQETGEDYDLNLALQDYRDAAETLIRMTRFYPVERILLVIGNDTLHIDSLQEGKIGVTTAGTPQDYDTRLAKMFTEARRVIVESAIDPARQVAPVDVLVVPGNHDEHSAYKLGEVLSAWYRNDDSVRILNAPTLRKYYTYGGNLLGLTHGLEFKRKREPLALIMMDEASRQGIDLGAHPYREWLTGHYHATAELEHMSPRQNLSETRGIRLRSLPGLTPADAWHTKEGYYHQRAATSLAYRHSGGLVGLHEFHP